jgi:N-acetylglucosamine-6-phosphate deacetylase
MQDTEFIIEDGVCKLMDRSAFAGSIATAERLLQVCSEAGLSVTEAGKMGSENPARLFGLNKGRIDIGCDADIIITDRKFNVQSVFLRGKKVK